MTKGISIEFSVSLNGVPINNNDVKEELVESNLEDIQLIDNTPMKQPEPTQNTKPNFVDSSKDPYYYVGRYYSEPTYKSWFDRNYPGLTIEEAVGYPDSIDEIKTTVKEIIKKDIIPEAQASSIVTSTQNTTNNLDIAQISLAVSSLGILFGAVYGVKRKVDNNSRQILINKDTIRKKIIKPIMGTSPLDILQTRLAKGEISLEEFENLEKKLK